MSQGGTADAGNADAELSMRRREAERLKRRALTDRRVLNKLQCVPDSATADRHCLASKQ